jgi:hypothetical protein
VQTEEPGGRKEGERDKEDPGIASTVSGACGPISEGGVDSPGSENEPEVRRVMLPDSIQVGAGDEKRQPQKR